MSVEADLRAQLSELRSELTATQCALDVVTAQRDQIAEDWLACVPPPLRPALRDHLAQAANRSAKP